MKHSDCFYEVFVLLLYSTVQNQSFIRSGFEMLQLPVDFRTDFDPILTKNERGIRKFKLNNELTLLFHICSDDKVLYNRISSIEIHRKNTDGGLLLSGELEMKNCYNNFQVWGKKFSEFITAGTSSKTILEGIYFANCNLYWIRGVVNIWDIGKKIETMSSQMKSLHELSNQFEKLLDTKTLSFTDVTIKCGSTSIPAHKNILGARSPVFAAMFSNPMKESQLNEVEITDIDVPILQALLNYMYTGKTNELCDSIAADLLIAADKYQLQNLKELCCDALKDTVSIQNVVKVLVLGDMFSEDLKSFTVHYICSNPAEFPTLEKSEEWKTLQTDKPALVIEVLTSMVNSSIKN